MTKLPASTARRGPCPVASALDLVGDKWTLLIIRDIGFFSRHRNKDFQQGVEKIPSNILANRLKFLLEKKLLRKQAYQDNPLRYEYFLTDAGKELLPVIKALAEWGAKNVAGTRLPRRFRKE